jgi:hypothetical protein
MMIWLSTLSRPLKVYQAYKHIQAWFTFTLLSNQILFHSGFFIGFNMYPFNLIILVSPYNRTSLLAWLIKKCQRLFWLMSFNLVIQVIYCNYTRPLFTYKGYFIGSLIPCCILKSWCLKLDPHPGLHYATAFQNWFKSLCCGEWSSLLLMNACNKNKAARFVL